MSDEQESYSRQCPVYALQPIKIMGMTSGSLLIVMAVTMGLNNVLGIANALGIGWVIAFSIERAAAKAKIPGGYLQYKLSVLAGNPFVLRYAPGLSQSIARIWTSGGLLAPPGVRAMYRP